MNSQLVNWWLVTRVHRFNWHSLQFARVERQTCSSRKREKSIKVDFSEVTRTTPGGDESRTRSGKMENRWTHGISPPRKIQINSSKQTNRNGGTSFYLLSQKQIVFVSLGGVHPTDGWGKVFSFNLFLAEKAQRRKLQWTPSRHSRAYQGILREGKLFPPTASRQRGEGLSQGSSR